MPTDCVPYLKSGYFSRLICDYLKQEGSVTALYKHFPTLDNFKKQIDEKTQSYHVNRTLLHDVIVQQYGEISLTEATLSNVQALKEEHTFTITTGHQLNLFGGPLYFLYKIITTINLAESLQKKYPTYRFVPIFWMATEDHDFQEINFFLANGKKYEWNRQSTGPVGELSTQGINDVLAEFIADSGKSQAASELQSIFTEAYLQNATLAQACRNLVNKLFGQYGLVIIDGNHALLKRAFIPYMEEELLKQTAYKEVQKTIAKWNYQPQVNPREINLFYCTKDMRKRIMYDGINYTVKDTDLVFTPKEIKTHLADCPHYFSPNVILRPLYQEVILPNLCYVGGGGEIAYWLQLKTYFTSQKTTFPILMLRNSALLVTEKQAKQAAKLRVSWEELFLDREELIKKTVYQHTSHTIDFTSYRQTLINQFNALDTIAKQTDPSFGNAVKAQAAKQIKGLDNLEKKLLRAEKRVYEAQVRRVLDLQNALFPGGLQERSVNFSEFYLKDQQLIHQLKRELDPWCNCFSIVQC